MQHLVVVGGGWSGCAAALEAGKKGLAVTLVERTDRLLASGLVGGIMRNNGRYTAAEELKMMGGGELFDITDSCSRHINLDFPGHKHASLYDVDRIEHKVQQILLAYGVRILYQSRVSDVEVEGKTLHAVRITGKGLLDGDFFIDATGTAGPPVHCNRSGNGCAMCIYRCPVFGQRVSVAVKAGLEEIAVFRRGGLRGFLSGSCELEPSSIAPWLLEKVRELGCLVINLPEKLRKNNLPQVKDKACKQYSSDAYQDNIIILDTGAIKMMFPFLSLQELRQIKGLERAVYRDPLGGSRGNSVRFTSLIRRDNRLKIPSLDNLLVAGERAGLALGHTEAIITGTLAGYNAWLISQDREPIALSRGTVSGEMIYFSRQKGRTREGRQSLYNLSGGFLWEHIKKHNLYTTQNDVIRQRLENAGLISIFS